jgi:hypothetical protein
LCVIIVATATSTSAAASPSLATPLSPSRHYYASMMTSIFGSPTLPTLQAQMSQTSSSSSSSLSSVTVASSDVSSSRYQQLPVTCLHRPYITICARGMYVYMHALYDICMI